SSPARLSTKHALALTNRGAATADDVIALAREVRDGVRDAFGVELRPEHVWVERAIWPRPAGRRGCLALWFRGHFRLSGVARHEVLALGTRLRGGSRLRHRLGRVGPAAGGDRAPAAAPLDVAAAVLHAQDGATGAQDEGTAEQI